MESALTLLPEPLSPTSASVSPLAMSKLTPRSASTARSPAPKVTARSRTSSSLLSPLIPDGSSQVLARVEGIADGFADEDEEGEQRAQHDEAGDAEPGRLQIGLRLM